MPRLLAAVVCASAIAACGAGAPTHPSTRTRSTARAGAHPSSRTPMLSYHPLFNLPAAVEDAGSAALGGERFILLGGLTSADTSSDVVTVAGLSGPIGQARLATPQHDAQATTLSGRVFLFGGGQYTQYDHILAYDPQSNQVTLAGTLPAAASDVAVAGDGSTAYVVGGFDGVHWLNTVLAYQPASGIRTLAQLPVPLRYAAAAVANGELVIAGGSTPTGASSAIYRVELRSGSVATLGQLPVPLTHAAAGVLNGTVYVVGGRGETVGARSAAIYAIDPATGRVTSAGSLPVATSDEAVISLADRLVVAGGATAAGVQAGVGELVAAAR